MFLLLTLLLWTFPLLTLSLQTILDVVNEMEQDATSLSQRMQHLRGMLAKIGSERMASPSSSAALVFSRISEVFVVVHIAALYLHGLTFRLC